jgi:hypothetical protein
MEKGNLCVSEFVRQLDGGKLMTSDESAGSLGHVLLSVDEHSVNDGVNVYGTKYQPSVARVSSIF